MSEINVSSMQPANRCCNFATLNRYEITLLIFGSLGLIATLGFAVAWMYFNGNYGSERFIFDIIILISSFFSLIYLHRGIFGERSYELMIYVISITCLVFYVIIDFIQNYQNASKLSYINLAVTVSILSVTIILGSFVAYDYNIRGNIIFSVIGGSERLQDDCKNLFIFESLLQLDFQFELCMITLILAVFNNFNIIQILTLAIGISFSILWHIGGFVTIRQELPIVTVVFLLLGILEPAYTVYITYNAVTSILNAISEPILNPVTPVVSVTFAICFISLMIRVFLMIMGIVVYKKFGNGLSDRLNYKCCARAKSSEKQPLLSNEYIDDDDA